VAKFCLLFVVYVCFFIGSIASPYFFQFLCGIFSLLCWWNGDLGLGCGTWMWDVGRVLLVSVASRVVLFAYLFVCATYLE
jgi:hypothetical protein